MQIYKDDFEAEFLKTTRVYYTAESTQFIAVNSISDYMKKVERRLQEEENRIRLYLHETTQKDVWMHKHQFCFSWTNHASTQLIKCCEEVLVEKHRDQIWAEFQPLLENDKTDGTCYFICKQTATPNYTCTDLARMYNLLSRISRGVDPLKDILEKHVQLVGVQAVESVASTAIEVCKLVNFVG